MRSEYVTVKTGGGVWTAWQRVMIRASFKEAARSFELEIADEPGSEIFQVFAPIEIYAGDDLVLRGYVDKVRPTFDANSASVTISGRSKGADAVDNSAVHRTGDFKQKTPLQIAQELDAHGIGFSSDIDLDPIDYHLTGGETIFRAVEKMCRAQGATLAGQADGSIKITNASKNRRKHAGGLFEGVNIKSASADHDGSNRHKTYKVIGQAPRGSGADALRLEAIAKDAGVTRDRVVVVVHDDDTDRKRLKKRAKNRRNRSAGNGTKASISTPWWRDKRGRLWTPGDLVWVQSKRLRLAQNMLIESFTFGQDAKSGTDAQLSLVDPRAHQGKAGKGAKSAKSWSLDDSDASDGDVE